MSYQTLITDLQQGIFTITIHRPEKLNALNQLVLQELDAAVGEVYENREIRCALITGAGEKAFVAGADISEFMHFHANEGTLLAERGQRIFHRIEQCPKPFLAAVNGFALGGGCELAMACHIRIASESAKFGQPEVNLGLIPGYGGTQRLTRLVGKPRALQMMMTGEMISAAEAERWGLVNKVVPADTLLAESRTLLSKIASRSSPVIAKLIACTQAYEDPAVDGFAAEALAFGQCFGTEDMQEGVQAFLEKRSAVFKDH